MALALALAACASAPEQNAELERAQAQVDLAQADPNVIKYAPLELDTAKKDLALAQSAAAHHKPEEVSQPAYMADQTARLALVTCRGKGGRCACRDGTGGAQPYPARGEDGRG